MSDLTPTAEQQLILERVLTTPEPLAIEARAGAAKTSTLVMIANALPPSTRGLALAFNKKIATEMSQRLPANIHSRTLNAMGNSAWKEFLGKWPQINAKKNYEILSALIDKLGEDERAEAFERMAETLQAVRTAKASGYVPADAHPQLRAGIIDESDFFGGLDEAPSGLQIDLINKVLVTSIKMAFQGHIDFDDQIYLSTLIKSVSFPRYELVMVDEAQDLSPLNHVMLTKIARGARLIAVGDPCQAIYGFRGADEDSMRSMISRFELRTLFLTVCFRCSPEIVANARWRAPDMQSFPELPPGSVNRPTTWSLSDVQDGDAIICRNNAPLFSLALELLRQRRSPELLSGDIVPGLIKILKKFGKPKQLRPANLEALAEWRERELKRSRAPNSVEDKAECLRIFIDEGETLGDAIGLLEQIANARGRIQLMTGHKSKGLEFDRVWFLDEKLCAPKGQDRNVKYVIETRARRELFYVSSDTLEESRD